MLHAWSQGPSSINTMLGHALVFNHVGEVFVQLMIGLELRNALMAFLLFDAMSVLFWTLCKFGTRSATHCP